jgi:hypothetical protein
MFTGKKQLANIEKLVRELASEATGLAQVGMTGINSDKRRLVHLAGKLNPSMNASELLESASNSKDPLTILATELQESIGTITRLLLKTQEFLETGNCRTIKITGEVAPKFRE